MWEKLCDYCLDISKYFMTAAFAAALLADLDDKHWLLYLLCGVIGIGLFCVGLFFNFKDKREKEQKRRRYKRFNNKRRRM